MTEPTTPTPTGIEALVVQDIAERQKLGIAKYGTTLADSGLAPLQILQHAYEEVLDQAVYLRAVIEAAKAVYDVEGLLVTGAFKGRPATPCVKCGIRFPKRKNRCRVCGWLQSEELPAATEAPYINPTTGEAVTTSKTPSTEIP
jgi:ribosomal protein L37E